MATTRTLILVGLLAGLLAACAGGPQRRDEAPDYMAWTERSLTLAAIQAWSMEGRVALRTEDDGWTASMTWSQWRDFMEFHLRGSFGIGSTRVHGTTDRIVIENSRGETWVSRDPARDLARETGWQVPLASLRWWMIGVPAPDSRLSEEVVDGQGRLVRLRQAGWEIEYSAYREVDGLMLPEKVRVESDEVRLRIHVRSWVVGERDASEAELRESAPGP